MTPIRVIIFEDNTSLRESLSQMIGSGDGFVFAGAFENCNEFLQNIENTMPDVILMDIQMPGMNGIEAVKIIRATYPEMKILMQTVFEDEEKIFQAIYAGASGYILKNTSPSRFLEFIRETYEGGAPMSPTIATKVLKMFVKKPDNSSNNFNLTEREKDILSCLVRGMSYKLAANECFISIDTVRGHIRNIYEKLHVHSKSEAVAAAIKKNIV
jgi:DNA-binding NarL/FixJ family response regulator